MSCFDIRCASRWLVASAIVVMSCLTVAGGARAEQLVNTTADGVAMDGYDTVNYFTDQKAAKGSPDFRAEWKRKQRGSLTVRAGRTIQRGNGAAAGDTRDRVSYGETRNQQIAVQIVSRLRRTDHDSGRRRVDHENSRCRRELDVAGIVGRTTVQPRHAFRRNSKRHGITLQSSVIDSIVHERDTALPCAARYQAA